MIKLNTRKFQQMLHLMHIFYRAKSEVGNISPSVQKIFRKMQKYVTIFVYFGGPWIYFWKYWKTVRFERDILLHPCFGQRNILDTDISPLVQKCTRNCITVLKSGLFLAVYLMWLSHAITWPFSKCFQILYIFALFLPFLTFFALFCHFSKKLHTCSYFLE